MKHKRTKQKNQIEGYDVIQPSMIKSIEVENTRIAMTYVNTVTTKTVRWNASLIWKDYTKFYVYPRCSNGKMINGSHNRAWKEDKFVGCILASRYRKYLKFKTCICYLDI